MPLSPGARLGPYEIVGPLGAGGMGEVYRARDTRLNRDVAVKILPDHLAANPDVKARFEREARAVSSLNHPNICTLHDIGYQDGVDYLVMECLEGETLAARLEKGPLPMEETLRVGIEIAGALHAAHRQGIVHRDLKPGNIMLTRAGAKLLDFGLARSGGLAAAPSSLTMSPTMSHPLTAEGTIVGTFQYMAPEQLEGHETDARTDVFAFGAVLYEMVTGRRAFDGKSHASLIGLIMSAQPPAMKDLAPVAPPALERLVRACMAKSPDDRCQSAHDVLLQLRWIAEGPGADTGPTPPAATGAKGMALWRGAAVLLGVVTVGLALAMMAPATKAPPAAAMRFSILPTPEAMWRPWNSMAISPDGAHLVYYAVAPDGSDGLWHRLLDSRKPRLLPGTDIGDAGFAFWSPDSRSIGFFAQGKLRTMQISGTAPVVLCDAPNGLGGSWGADGMILFSAGSGSPILRIPAMGGEASPVTTLERGESARHVWPSLLPDGKHFSFLSVSESGGASWLSIGSIEGGMIQKLVAAESGAIFDAGQMVYVRDRDLVAQPFDLVSLKMTGAPEPIAEAVSRNQDARYTAFTLSRTGTLLYRGGADAGRELVWFDRDGSRRESIGLSGDLSNPDLSPDGSRVVVGRREVGAITDDLWVYDIRRGAPSRLTFGKGDSWSPIWSADGTQIYFTGERNGEVGIYVKDAQGANDERLVLAAGKADDAVVEMNDVTRDGRYLLYQKLVKEQSDLWVAPLAGGGAPAPVAMTDFDEANGRVSPDARWIVYHSNESGKVEIYVRPFLRPGGKWQISIGGGAQAHWRADGREIYYLGMDRRQMVVRIEASGEMVIAGTPQLLFATPARIVSATSKQYAASADGQRFLIFAPVAGAENHPIDVVLNWSALLRGAGH